MIECALSPRTFDCPQKLGPGFHLPARMTVLLLASGELAIVSPIPIDDQLAARIAALGEVRFLIAPNLLHHLYLQAASERYPSALVLAPAGLRKKRPELRIDGELSAELPAGLLAAVDVLRFEGAPALDEYVLFHRATRTLVVTDLVFNMVRPEGWLTHLVLWLVGCRGRLAQSRLVRQLVKERSAASHSVQQMLERPFETLIVAHGEIVREAARAQLTDALRWLLPSPRRALPEAAQS